MSTTTMSQSLLGGVGMPLSEKEVLTKPVAVSGSYEEIRRLIDKESRRPKILRPDGTEGTGRKHHLKPEKVLDILRRWHETGEFVSPYSKGVYTYTLMALVKLGVNKAHSISKVLEKMKGMMQSGPGRNGLTDWERFMLDNTAAKNHLEPKAKIWQNARQFVRYGGENPYGLKLSQIGCVVDRFETLVGPHRFRYIRLNTYAFRGLKEDNDALVVQPLYLDGLPGVESIPAVEMRPEWTMGPKTPPLRKNSEKALRA